MRTVAVVLGAALAVALGLAAAAHELIHHDGPERDAAIRYARCHYDRRTNRVIAMATLRNPNHSAVSFTVGASYLVQIPRGHGGLGHRRWSMIGFGAIPDRRHRLSLRIDGGRHLWWVARTPPIRHHQVSGERVLCRFFASAPSPANAGEND
jgi:hypothetical protein